MTTWLILFVAIVCEVVATSALKASEGFTRLAPSLVVVIGYVAAFYFLSLTLKHMSVGIAYAIWAGVGTFLVALVGIVLYKQRMDMAGVLGIGLILAGVVVLNLFSDSTLN